MNEADEKIEITLDKVTGAIEAILFAAGHPIEYSKLSEVLGISVKDVKNMVEVMSEEYNSEKSKHGLLLLMYPESCQLATKEEFLPYIREALGIKRGGNLSASTLEALAVVAYNQPVTRMYVDTLRRADSSYAMNNLIDRGLIECKGRMDVPGRPMLYGTTNDFLRCFGLGSLADLPGTSEELMALFAQGKNVPDKPEEEIEGGEQLEMEVEANAPTEDNKPAEETAEAPHEEEVSAEDDVIDYE